jgi:mycofactocin precursor
MDDLTTLDQPTTLPVTDAPTSTPAADALLEEELLVEEISIDGMCGVY